MARVGVHDLGGTALGHRTRPTDVLDHRLVARGYHETDPNGERRSAAILAYPRSGL